MNEPASLRDLQHALARRITRGDGANLSARIRSDHGIPAEERLFVYAHAWFARLHEVLREDYGALAEALGKDAFHDLAKLYFRAHPPRSHSLRFLGEGLCAFLRSPVAELFAGVAEKIGEAEVASALVGLIESWIGERLLAAPEGSRLSC